MEAEFCLLHDWEQTQQFLQSLGFSRAHLKKYLSSKELKRPLRARQVASFSLNLLNSNFVSPVYSGPAPRVIKEDENFLVLHKPPGVHGHPLSYLEQDNLLAWLRSQGRGQLLQVAPTHHERGLLYRLDQGTSGVMVYVKNHTHWQSLRDNFNRLAHVKRYVAVIEQVPTVSGNLQAWFELGRKKVKASLEPQADLVNGQLFLQIVRADENGCVVVIDLNHGHRHQIRAHMAALGLPLRGDTLYGGREAQRLFLHAYQYEIKLDADQSLVARDEELGFGSDFLNLNRDLEVLSNHGRIIHRR